MNTMYRMNNNNIHRETYDIIGLDYRLDDRKGKTTNYR